MAGQKALAKNVSSLNNDHPIDMDLRGEEKAVIRLFGVNSTGHSVAAYIHNFTAYFYIQVNSACQFQPPELAKFKDQLNSMAQNSRAVI